MNRKNQTSPRPAARLLSLAATAFSLLAMLLLVCSTASAQLAGKGAISGKVADPSGAAVPGATVVVTKDATSVSVTTTSTSAGDFEVSTLDPGVYTITITATGFEKLLQKNVQINALETQTFNAQLTVGAATQEVTVSSAPPQLETTNATLGATMDQEMYSALPIEMGAYGNPDQRRATDFAFLMPGVQGNDSGNATTNTGIVNGSGTKGAVSDVYIDGVAFVRAGGNGDPRYVWTAISVDAVDQFQVQTSGYSAIYEGQGIQNYTVKQGGSKYHGAIYSFVRNTILDTWGFFGPANKSPVTGLPVKPIENSNEYGINLSGPLVPFGTWKDKLFAFGNYNGFRYSSANPTYITLPTTAEQAGDFSGIPVVIYDPSTAAACTAANAGVFCRNPFPGNKITTPLSTVATNMEAPLKGLQLSNQNPTSNYLAPNKNGLVNWSTTDRVDYFITPKDTLTMVAAIGRQASSSPAGQTTAGRNVGPIPYNYGQIFAPKTAVGVIEETHVFSSHIVNQLKYGYARYNGPTIYANQVPAFSATSEGVSGLPVGSAQQAFPIVNFGTTTDSPTGWGATGSTYPNLTLAENYTLVDNLQWVKDKHTITVGGQTAWLLYNTVNGSGGSTPITFTTAPTETAGITKGAATPNTGLAYASFLLGQMDKGSFTQYLQQEFGARFRAISPYVQDNWKVNSKLTLDIGLRYDYFPTVTEVHNAESFFDPNLTNPVTGLKGALNYTGTGTNTCNCSTPVHNFMKNFGPRLGLAYQVDPKTVVRASYGVMFTHGNAVGGSASSLGTTGFSAAPSFSGSTVTLLGGLQFTGANGAIPTFAGPCGTASGPQFGTGYTTTSSFPNAAGCGAAGSTASYTGTPTTLQYDDPYYGSRAPEFVSYTLGFQHQWTDAFTSTITYVGTQGHFLPTDGGNPRGLWVNQLDPKYLGLGATALTSSGAAATAVCVANNLPCPANFTSSQNLGVELTPFPFQKFSDTFGFVANSNYNALQVSLNMRASHGLTFMANYTWSRAIDDGGTFRSGYDIPAAFSQNGKAWAADRIERTVSASNQPQHVVVTGVWNLPTGKQILGHNAIERAIFGGYKFSEVFQAFSGSPLTITGTCGANPSQGTCAATYNPAFIGKARINGKWGQGITAANTSAISYINSAAFMTTPAYMFGNAARTAPYNISGPGNYQLDIALVRSFPLHITESSAFSFRAELYNVTNHTWFAVASTVWTPTTSNFGDITTNANYARRAAQLSARLTF